MARLRQVVTTHQPADRVEAAAADTIASALDRLAHPLDEHADPTHVTASGIVVGERGVVLHMHRRLGRWLQPGGHLEAGEPPEEAAVRECREETGLEVTHPPAGPLLVHLDVHTAARDHVHLDFCYLVLAPDLDPCPPPEESQAVAWFSWEAAEGLADGGLSAALRSARRVMPTPTGHQGRKEPR